MRTIHVTELSNHALHYLVAKLEGFSVIIKHGKLAVKQSETGEYTDYSLTTIPHLMRHIDPPNNITCSSDDSGSFVAITAKVGASYKDPIMVKHAEKNVAILQAYVMSAMGEMVQIPKNLI